jgi:predicted ATP-grasp superfamily ATP-dependent carboligase
LAGAREAGPPAVILGSTGSALSLTRSLGRAGVTVFVLGDDGASLAAASRYCYASIRLGGYGEASERWLDWLERYGPSGAVLLPPGDEGLELVIRHRSRLDELGYRLPETVGEVSLAMLDKSRTYELARRAGVACPRTWVLRGAGDVAALREELPFPCALKPVHSHLFAKRFTSKVLLARDEDELARHVELTRSLGLEMIATEVIPGPERDTWTYSTYLDERGEPLLGLTRNKLRSFPIHFGTNSYVVTRWSPEVAEAGLHFLRGVGLRGLANVEFKRDSRDGELKLIECNHRFVNVQELMLRAGLDMALFVYNRALGRPTPPAGRWREDVRLWFPARDWRAARDYRRERELTWAEWLRSLAHRRVHTPVLASDDVRPFIASLWAKVRRRLPAWTSAGGA